MEQIAKMRRFKGLTQTDMADYLGISLQSYSRKELGKVPFNDEEKVKVINFFKGDFPNISIESIFFAML